MESKNKLLHPIFLLSIALLLINDFFLKSYFHNILTGKLSDFAGLFAFPFFWSAVFPEKTKAIHFSTVILFLFWKSEWSQPLIDLINQFGFPSYRTVDYADYLALSSVLLSYLAFIKIFPAPGRSVLIRILYLVSIFSFVATSKKREALAGEENFKTIDLQNQGAKRLIAIVNFKYSASELKKNSSLNNEFNRVDTFYLSPGMSERIIIPIRMGKTVEFPAQFKISILDSLGKFKKAYGIKSFFKAVDSSYNQQPPDESAAYWNLKVGEKIPDKIKPSTIYGRWQTPASAKKQHTFEIRERYYYDVNPDGELVKYAIKDSLITVFYPHEQVEGKVVHLKGKDLTIKWNNRKTVYYEKIYD